MEWKFFDGYCGALKKLLNGFLLYCMGDLIRKEIFDLMKYL